MCEPMSIAAAALTAGSILAKTQADRQAQKARTGAMNAELTRQRGFDNEAFALNEQSRDRYQDFEGQREGKAQSVADYFAAQRKDLPANEAGAVIPTSSSNITVQETAKQRDKAASFGRQQDQALSQLRSFGDLLGGISRDQARDAGQIGTISSFKRGSQGVLPLELAAAAKKGSGLRTFGDILGAAGMALSMGSMAGVGAGAGAATGAPTNLAGNVGVSAGAGAGASQAASTGYNWGVGLPGIY